MSFHAAESHGGFYQKCRTPRLLALFATALLATGCTGALQGGTINWPNTAPKVRAVATIVQDPSGARVLGAACTLHVSADAWQPADALSNGDGYVIWSVISADLGATDVHCTAPDYEETTVARVLTTKGDETVAAVLLTPTHVDPGRYTTAQLLTFRGALFTVKANHLPPATGFCDLPDGPRPHQPDNIAVFASYYYTKEQRACVYQLWKERGYTHGPVGPFIDPGYHGTTPGVDFRQDGGAAEADILQEVWDAGLIPVVFVTPDGWTVEQLRTLEPIFKSPRWQHLVRVVVNGYEQQGGKYGWSNAQYVAYLSWLRDVFPDAVRGLHTISDIEAPVGNGDDTSRPGMSNGDCWARVAPLIHFWLHQSNALFDPTHVADNGKTDGENWLALWDKTNPYSFINRFGKGTAGWPTTSANGGPLIVVPGEYASYVTWWQNQPEDVARTWGAKALAAGATGFMDGGR